MKALARRQRRDLSVFAHGEVARRNGERAARAGIIALVIAFIAVLAAWLAFVEQCDRSSWRREMRSQHIAASWR